MLCGKINYIKKIDSPPPYNIVFFLPNNQRQHRTLHVQMDVLSYALYRLLCPVSAALASIFRMDSISTPYREREILV